MAAGEAYPAEMTISVFLVDDHEIVRRGLADLLEGEPDMRIAGEAASVGEALTRIPGSGADVAVLDVRLPDGNGVELCRELLSRTEGLKCLMLTSYHDDEALLNAIMAGAAMYQRPPRGDVAWFHAARRLLLELHRRGVAHNDLAKEANWLVLEDGRPALIDFQLASRGDPRSRWMRLLFREDLRHLLKHKRMYCREALTPVEKRMLRRNSWVRDLWFRTGKPVYRFVTRRILKWEDNEGQGPKP